MRCSGSFLNRFCFVMGGVLFFCNFSHIFAITANKQHLVKRNMRVRRPEGSPGKIRPLRTVLVARRRQVPGGIVPANRLLAKNWGRQLLSGSRNLRPVRAIRGRRVGSFAPNVYPKKLFRWPIKMDKFWISSYYGSRSRGRLHAGLDLAASKGTPVYAAADGIVK